MKNLVYLIIVTGSLFIGSSCKDFLEDTGSPSVVDEEFIFSDPANIRGMLLGAFDTWRDSRIHSNGLFYELSVCSSDAERHPEKYADQTRHIPENLYYEGTQGFDTDFSSVAFSNAFSIIATCNNIINGIETKRTEEYEEFIKNGEPTAMSQIYGETVTLRATLYFELLRYFGDIPHSLEAGVATETLTSRDEIYEYHINKLIEVEPVMYRVGESDFEAIYMTRTYVQGLIGRMSLYAGGYSTRRTDLGNDFYKNLNGEVLSFSQIGSDNSGGRYTRRSDYLTFYVIAKTYLAACVADPGTAELVTTDPRSGSNGEEFGNPFQYVFQQMLDQEISSESIYEITETWSSYSERPYAFGRPSNGGGSNNYPCKSYGQSRMHPVFYYGDFDQNDLRRDATVAVTCSSGKGVEMLLSLIPGNKAFGGLGNNKWDDNRMATPYTKAQRSSGVNNPYMRMSDVILMLAEVYAELDEEGNAKIELAKVHNRAFANESLANLDGFISKNGGIKAAILEERKLEFAGEGIRKWDLIRNGILLETIKSFKLELAAWVSGLEQNGYYEFENGNIMPNYVWTKEVNADSIIGHRLTTECPDRNNPDPILYPGWRGQHNDWKQVAVDNGDSRTKVEEEFTNLAIQGLFRYIDPTSAEAIALEADGYTRQRWGADIVGTKIADEGDLETTSYSEEYSDFVFRGFIEDAAPIYMVPLTSNILLTSDGQITNGYGFDQQ